MLNGELLGGGVLTGQIGREVITISKEEQDVVIEPRREQFDVYPDVGKVIKKATVKAVTSDIDENIVASNIRSGVTILGVTGDFKVPQKSLTVKSSAEEEQVIISQDVLFNKVIVEKFKLQTKEIKPYQSVQVVADEGYDGLKQVNINVDTAGTNIQGYKYQDLSRVIRTGGEFATDEAYESAENYLQGLYALIIGG